MKDPSNGIVTPRINLVFSVGKTISGIVQKPSGEPMAGVTVTLSGPDSATAVTDANGRYNFDGLTGGTYSVQPDSSSVAFSPSARTVTAPASGVNFTALLYALSGSINTSKGTPVPGVMVTLSGGPVAGSVMTDATGNYRFVDLPAGNYMVTPYRSGYTFSVSAASVALNMNVTGQNFTVLTYKISGHVYATAAGAPLSGVKLVLSGNITESVISAADGSFAFDDLMNGTFTVTPTRSGYSFAPLSMNVVISGADQNNVAFFRAVTLSGRVKAKKGSMVFPNVSVTLSGASSAETVTDRNGYYQFTELVPGRYTITPRKLSFVFSPATKSVTLTSKNISSDFSVINSYSLSGTVKNTAGSALSGVSLAVTGCDITATAVTDRRGNFKVLNLPNCSYTISPNDALGRTFTPSSRSVTISKASVSGIAFIRH